MSNSVHLRRFARALLVGCLTAVAGALTVSAHPDTVDLRWPPPETIAEAARAAAATGAGDTEAVAIDSRLKLSRCESPLDAKMERAITRGYGTVVVSCAAPISWRLFLPVRARNDVAVVVLVRNVQPGEVLTPEDVAVARRTSASLPYDYLSDSGAAIGNAPHRPVPS